MNVYYNENDPHAAAWLLQLIAAGLIPAGDVDERSICDVQPADVAGYTQCHFFAGIGGWAYALELAGWGDAPVWTGSCPCQPFSLAGKRKGFADSRDLWPWFANLIEEREPPDVFGEQVAGAAGHKWFRRLRADLEALGYAVGGGDLCAAGIGAHHCRTRIYWGASSNANRVRSQRQWTPTQRPWTRQQFEGLVQATLRTAVPSGTSGGLSDGLPARMVRLRGYGNAIVPQVAAEFIQAYCEAREEIGGKACLTSLETP